MGLVPGSEGSLQWTANDEDVRRLTNTWKNEQGRKWVQRNPLTAIALDAHYYDLYGVTKTAVAEAALAAVPRDTAVLEVGVAAGLQLRILQGLGFRTLYGVDLCAPALPAVPAPAAAADACRLPFRDGAFGLVFTSGTLMHIPPARVAMAAKELTRVARSWVWLFEPHGDFRENIYADELLPPSWTRDVVATFLSANPGWVCRHQQRVAREDQVPGPAYLSCLFTPLT